MGIKFENNFKKAKTALETAQIKALESVGVVVDGEAVTRCPFDTGNLRSSINHEVDEGAKTVTIGTSTEYAPYVEFGTYKQGEQPFLTPAFEENVGKLKDLVKSIISGDMK